MENNDILFLALIIFFCFCSVIALIFNAHSKSRVPLVIFSFSGILVIAFSLFLLLDRPEASQKYERDYIALTSYQNESSQKGRKTHKAEENNVSDKTEKTSAPAKSDSDIVFITMHGKKYHFSLECGSGEFYECTLKEAKERGLEPCKKCAQ